MKILAIIPACEGSRSLPNKNLRIINGKPMIYYAIRNAMSSHYITDVLVTTNSKEILLIASQMGAIAKEREEALCSPAVSLDKVVYTVGQDIDFSEYSYVITMQSISPTLKVSTLDDAIGLCISKDYDTMISVTNRANFYWRRENHQVDPLQSTRMNKHSLPPFYMETGAFLITKPQFITENSRIGNRCELYELKEQEAIDVFSFGDLRQAENILSEKSVAFYVNGNNQRGMGHIYRVFQLADEFFSKPDIYYDIHQTTREMFGKTTHNLIPVDGLDDLYQRVKQNKYDIFINDILSTSADYMQALKDCNPDGKIINFEDEGSGASLADLVFNALYEEKIAKNVKVGTDYFIASKLFLLYEPIEIREKVTNVLVTFGGADPQNYTDRILQIIENSNYAAINFWIVIGRAKSNYEQLLHSSYPANINMLYNINNMPEIMSKCDIAITSRGRTGFELALLGIPTISMAQNERETKHDFMNESNGFIYLGKNPSDEMIEFSLGRLISMKQSGRMEMQLKMLKKNLRNGRKHIMNLIDNL